MCFVSKSSEACDHRVPQKENDPTKSENWCCTSTLLAAARQTIYVGLHALDTWDMFQGIVLASPFAHRSTGGKRIWAWVSCLPIGTISARRHKWILCPCRRWAPLACCAGDTHCLGKTSTPIQLRTSAWGEWSDCISLICQLQPRFYHSGMKFGGLLWTRGWQCAKLLEVWAEAWAILAVCTVLFLPVDILFIAVQKHRHLCAY